MCGASQGIGAAAAEELAGLGCRVLLLARTQHKLEDLAESLAGSGHLVAACDIGDHARLKRLVTDHLREQGPIHILVNNTGGPPPGPLVEAEADIFQAAFHNHIITANLLSSLLLPGMKESGYGRIINVISTSVKMPIANLGVSNTIRGAMASWAKTMANELGSHGVTVNNVLPGYTETPRLAKLIANTAVKTGQSEAQVSEAWKNRVPLRRFGDPKETGAAIAFLASPAAAYISGINLPVDGGRTGCL